MSNTPEQQALEDRIEYAYWMFDARRKGYSRWRGRPMSERDAFKAELRSFYAEMQAYLPQAVQPEIPPEALYDYGNDVIEIGGQVIAGYRQTEEGTKVFLLPSGEPLFLPYPRYSMSEHDYTTDLPGRTQFMRDFVQAVIDKVRS